VPKSIGLPLHPASRIKAQSADFVFAICLPHRGFNLKVAGKHVESQRGIGVIHSLRATVASPHHATHGCIAGAFHKI
jgi:hypothetical protein